MLSRRILYMLFAAAVAVAAIPSSATKPSRPSMHLTQRISEISVAAPQTYGGLTIYPLTLRPNGGPDYLTLDEATRQKSVEIVEKDGGQVDQVTIRNNSRRPVFIMDGEEIIGAKQNRILNSSVLIPGRRSASLPVSCVEQGRWTGATDRFSSGGTQLFAKARQTKVADVNRNYAAEPAAGARSDQQKVWAHVAAKRNSLRLGNEAGPMHEAYTKNAVTIDDYVKHFRPVKNQVGALFVMRGEIVGADVFDQNQTLQALLPKMIKSYALDAMETPRLKQASGKLGMPTVADARKFLDLIERPSVSFKSYPSPGEGSDVRISSPDIQGSALVVDGKALHIALFAPERPKTLPVSPGNIRPPSQRR